jgi:hypothetical protein
VAFKRSRLLASALALVQLCSVMPALARPFPLHLSTGLCLVHVRPIKADENEENTMTIIDFALLTTALARLVTAVLKLITSVRQRR